MAPAEFYRMAEKPEGGFAWTVTRILKTGEATTAQTPLGEVTLKGTKEGFDVVSEATPVVDHVEFRNTDEWNLPTNMRTFTDEHGELRVKAVTEESVKAMQTEVEKTV